MPMKVVKRNGKFRVVEPSGKIAKNAKGTAVDGGGFASRASAVKQVQAININKHK